MGVFDKYTAVLENLDPIKFTGVVERVQGMLIESLGPSAQVGELCQILVPKGRGVVWSMSGLISSISPIISLSSTTSSTTTSGSHTDCRRIFHRSLESQRPRF